MVDTPVMASAGSVVIVDGSVPSFLALWRQGVCMPSGSEVGVGGEVANSGGGSKPHMYVPAGLSEATLKMIDRWVAPCRVASVIKGETSHAMDGPEATAMLLGAGNAALTRSISRIIWPIQFSGSARDDLRLDRVARAFDRALLCARTLAIDTPESVMNIETPLLDMTDQALMDLAGDLDAPIGMAFPCAFVSAVACGVCETCRRWVPHVASAGLTPTVARLRTRSQQVVNA